MSKVRSALTGQAVSQFGSKLAHGAVGRAPEMSSRVVHEALERALRGVGPLPPAATMAESRLSENDGDVDKAIREVIRHHIALAAAQGMLTNLGGLVTTAAAIPANLAGLAVVQLRMVGAIAHLRGYDVDDPRTRNAILALMLGPAKVQTLVRRRQLPAPPMALATAPQHDPQLDAVLAAEVAAELVTRVAGRRVATTIGRRVPVLGGVVGAGTDGFATHQVGGFAAHELRQRPRG